MLVSSYVLFLMKRELDGKLRLPTSSQKEVAFELTLELDQPHNSDNALAISKCLKVIVKVLKKTNELIVSPADRSASKAVSFCLHSLQSLSLQQCPEDDSEDSSANSYTVSMFFLRPEYSTLPLKFLDDNSIERSVLRLSFCCRRFRRARRLFSRTRKYAMLENLSTHTSNYAFACRSNLCMNGERQEEEETKHLSRKRIKPLSFYGAEAPTSLKRSYQSFRSFPRQAHAFDYVDTMNSQDLYTRGEGWMRPGIFCIEHPKSGRRQFVAAGRKSLFNHILDLSPLERHVYEIIREDSPCRLYFDLEYMRCCNAGVDGNKMIDKLVHVVAAELSMHFHIRVRNEDIVDLDSGNERKFSRHLIFHCRKRTLPVDSSSESTSTHAKLEDPVALSLNGRESEILFENNRSCGVFVRYIVQKYRHIFLVNKEGSKEKTSFVDTGVYTRNRAFRMYLSCKFGKQTVLEPAKSSLFKFDDTSEIGIVQLLEASMISPPIFCSTNRFFESCSDGGSDGDKISPKTNWIRFQTFAMGRSFTASLSSANQTMVSGYPSQSTSSPSQSTVSSRWNDGTTLVTPCLTQEGVRLSPYPFVDRYIVSFASKIPNRQAQIRSWVILNDRQQGPVITYNMTGNRYCRRIGREHKSNNVFFVVSLTKRVFHQSCYDPDCRAFKSKLYQLPATALPLSQRKQERTCTSLQM